MTSSSDPTEVTLMVAGILDRLGVRYAVAGSLASSLHGVFRASVDAGMVADLRLEHVDPFEEALGDSFYHDSTAIRRAIELQRSFNVIHLESMFKVDVFIPKHRTFDEAQLQRRKAHIIATNPERFAYVASAEGTVLAKLDWYRAGGDVSEQQWRDVLGILGVQRGRLEVEYLRSMADTLGITDLLDRALAADNAET